MKQSFLALIFCALFVEFGFSQETIHCWNFNNGSSSTTGQAWNSPLTTDARRTGNGTITHNFTFTEDFAGGDGNLCSGTSSAGSAIVAEDSVNNGNTLNLEFSTVGYEDIELSFWVRRSSDGFDSVAVQYSVDGGDNFINHGFFNPVTNGAGDVETFDFSSISAVDNNADFVIRFVLNGATGEFGNIWIDNISLEGNQLPSVNFSLTGTEGWRLISSPVSGSSFDQVIGDIWTQGFTGSDSPSNGTSNIYSYDETVTTGSENDGFVSITDQTNTMGDATGYAMYIFEDNDYTEEGIQGGFPKALSITGTAPTSDVGPVSFTFTSSDTASNDGWNLTGNPFGNSLNVDDLGFASEADLDNFVYVYRNGAYTALDASGSANSDTVAAGEGFFVKVNAAVSYTFPFASASKRTAFNFREIDFTISNVNYSSNARIRFHEKADYGKEAFDAYYLTPLDARHVGFYSKENEHKLSVNSYPFNIDGSLSIPLEISGSETGWFSLKWKALTNFDENWSLELIDLVANRTLDLTNEKSYTFEVENITDTRISLVVTQATSVNNETDLKPQEFTLQQNYPNPFNPTTTINYSVENAGQVTISVYNLMGQKVAELVNESKAAGSYNVTWNAANAASGMYYYRLEAGGQSMTRKMTLIK